MACYIYIFISGTVQDILMKFCTHIQTTKTGHTAKFCDCVINELFFSFFFSFLHFTGGTSGDDPYFVSNQNSKECNMGILPMHNRRISLGILKGLTPSNFFCMFCFYGFN